MNCKYGMHDIFTHARKYEVYERNNEELEEDLTKLQASHWQIKFKDLNNQLKNHLALNSSSNSEDRNSSQFFKCKE